MRYNDPRTYYTDLSEAVEDEIFPMAILDKLKYFENIAFALKQSRGKSIRIATKSLRVPYLIQRLIGDYNQVTGAMSYHGAEAVYLASLGIDDILMGYPVMDKTIMRQVGEINKSQPKITLMVDSRQHLDLIESIGKQLSVRMPVCIDIDLSMDVGPLHFGVWRSPIHSDKSLIELLERLKTCQYIRPVGLMGYEAQIAGVPDISKEYGLKNILIRKLKKNSIRKLRIWRKKAMELISEYGFDIRIINGGGTGSLASSSTENTVNEITIGSGFYGSHFFDNYRGLSLAPALFYALQITRRPAKNRFTAHAGGYIASGQVESLKQPKIYLPSDARLIRQEGAGEVQTPFVYSGPIDLKIGQPIFLRHAKAGELLEHFNEILVYEQGAITDRLKTYRGLGMSFG